MLKKPLFRGAATALITPFDDLDRVDFGAFADLLDAQLEAGIDALVVGGTIDKIDASLGTIYAARERGA